MFLKNFFYSMKIQDVIIYLLMMFLLFCSLKNKKKTIMYANFIAALGMIGTFLGICIGLNDFNPNAITESIPTLLQGMKTAFFTSLIGMSVSIALKYKYGSSKEKTETDSTEDAITEQTEKIVELNNNIKEMTKALNNIGDIVFKDSLRKKEHDLKIVEVMENLNHLELIKEALKDIDLHIGDINNSIGDNIEKQSELSTRTNELLLDLSGSSKNVIKNTETIIEINKENTSTIISEFKQNNTENSNSIILSNKEILKAVEDSSEKAQESSSELVTEFKEFAKTMAENNNKAFIQALNESMKDLNTRLTEQFGENFKELNKAVFKLVEWQEHYKNTVIETTENQKVIFEGINKAKDDLAHFVTKGEQVSQIADSLQQTINTTKEQQAEFNSEIKVLSDINESAKELMPNLSIINANIGENLNTFKHSLDEISSNINKVTTEAVGEIQKTHSEFSNSLNVSKEEFNTLLIDSASNFGKVSSDTMNELKKAYTDLSSNIDASKEEFSTLLAENTLSFKENNEKIIAATDEQVTNVILKLNDLSEKLLEESNIKTQSYLENINSLFEKAIDNIKQMNINLEKEGMEVNTKTSQAIEQLNAQVSESLKTNVENINNGLEAALNASLKSLGDELATLSNKFIKDYTPLTENLKNIVSMSKGVRR